MHEFEGSMLATGEKERGHMYRLRPSLKRLMKSVKEVPLRYLSTLPNRCYTSSKATHIAMVSARRQCQDVHMSNAGDGVCGRSDDKAVDGHLNTSPKDG